MKIGITVGDINGIGIEVIIRALSNPRILKLCTPIIYGSSKVLSYHKNIVNPEFQFNSCQSADRASRGKVNVVNCWEDNVNINIGKPEAEAGKLAHIAMDRACQEAKAGLIDAIVTAPINKAVMDKDAFPYGGHTEYFTHYFDVKESLMTMVTDDIRIALVTNHIPVSEVATAVTAEKIQQKLDLFEKSLKVDFSISKPTIAVLGLNPHAGDEGKIGNEEVDFLRPLIIKAKKSGKNVMGPYPADGFFGSSSYKKVDGILAMYHDQGLIPFKTLSFGDGVNFTAGLPIVRTSPDHGTAYDIAGKNKADGGSMLHAIFKAIDIARERKEYKEVREEKEGKKPKQTEEVQE